MTDQPAQSAPSAEPILTSEHSLKKMAENFNDSNWFAEWCRKYFAKNKLSPLDFYPPDMLADFALEYGKQGWQDAHDPAACGHPRACQLDRNWPLSEQNYNPETKTSEPPIDYRCIMCEAASDLSFEQNTSRKLLKVAEQFETRAETAESALSEARERTGLLETELLDAYHCAVVNIANVKLLATTNSEIGKAELIRIAEMRIEKWGKLLTSSASGADDE